MGDRHRRELTDEMHDHEREVAQLSQAIAHIDVCDASQGIHQQVVYLTAQIMKHRISMALLASRLGDVAPVLH